jgi:release factor glutamine methyltransferase
MPEPEQVQVANAPTIGSALRELTAVLTRAGIEGAGSDVRRLMAAVLGMPGATVLSSPETALTSGQFEMLRRHVERRSRHEPVSRILGERDFYGRTFVVSPATLDPRPDSETLIVAALDIVREEGWREKRLRILDVGTGTGCLLLTLLAELPHACGIGTDVSAAALDVAAANAHRLGLAQRAIWQQADTIENSLGRFDILIANPPYVRTAEIAHLDPEVRNFDPHLALDGGADGLALYRRLIPRIPSVIPIGWAMLEVGHDQADAVIALLSSGMPGTDGARIRIYRDVAGRRRCVAVKTRG